MSGPDPISMALSVPRASVWLGDVCRALAQKDASLAPRRADWKAAAEAYTKAGEEWQKMHGRADFFRYQPEIAECAKKALECNQRATSGV